MVKRSIVRNAVKVPSEKQGRIGTHLCIRPASHQSNVPTYRASIRDLFQRMALAEMINGKKSRN